jgi:hypothetical protein
LITLPDSGPLIARAKLNRLHLLAELYTSLRIVRSVYREAVEMGLQQAGSRAPCRGT